MVSGSGPAPQPGTLRILAFGFLGRLHDVDMESPWPLATDSTASSSALHQGRAGTEGSNLLIMVLATSPHPQLGYTSHLINIKEDTFIALIIEEIPRVLDVLCQKWEKDQIILLTVSHKVTLSLQVLVEHLIGASTTWRI